MVSALRLCKMNGPGIKYINLVTKPVNKVEPIKIIVLQNGFTKISPIKF